MATITVQASGEDRIVVRGAVHAEFGYQYPGYGQASGDLLAFSDGTVLRVYYAPTGVWRITLVTLGTASLDIDQVAEDNEDTRSDTATLTGDICWVVQGIEYTTVKGA